MQFVISWFLSFMVALMLSLKWVFVSRSGFRVVSSQWVRLLPVICLF